MCIASFNILEIKTDLTFDNLFLYFFNYIFISLMNLYLLPDIFINNDNGININNKNDINIYYEK